MWLECARETFESLGPDADGVVATAGLLDMLKRKLGDDDVDLAVEEAMIESCAASCGVTFDDFVSLLSTEAAGAPAGALYDSRFVGSPRAAAAVAVAAAADADGGGGDDNNRIYTSQRRVTTT
jgi:hypothetical protein